MRQREIEMLMEYIMFEMTRLEQDVQKLQQSVRYRSVDAVDCLELCLALERLNSFKRFSSDVRHLLRLELPDSKE